MGLKSRQVVAGSPTRKSAPMGGSVHVALLRGINVGGKNKLPMQDLIAMFRAAGCRDVRSTIQSGNVVFEASSSLADRICKIVAVAIENRFGYRIPIVTRTAQELARAMRDNPFLKKGVDTAALHTAFLADVPPAERVAALNPNRSPTDEFAVCGRDIYLYCPHGMARTKLTNQYFDSTLATISTVRNWNTVCKLAEMISR